MKKNCTLFFLLFFFIFPNMEAQLVYQKKIYELPVPHFSLLYNTERAVDSGYIIAGASSTPTNLAGFLFVAKINEQGDTVWTRRYDGPEYEYGYIKNFTTNRLKIYKKSRWPKPPTNVVHLCCKT